MTTTKASVPTDTHADSKVPKGPRLLHDPVLNKGTAFTEEERDALNLRGLLPPRVCSQDQQVARIMENFHSKTDDLEKFIYMISLQDRNETLFYRVVMDHLDEMLPIIYTPTVGRACERYGHIYRRSRGLFLSAEDQGRAKTVLQNWPQRDARVIVVTDGERILGLGDQGANGMGIPVGKLSLYVACAGIKPSQCLPVALDVGTDNETLLSDPLYIGLGRRRLRGEEYDAFVEEFVQAAVETFPDVLIQFEDFANRNAFPLLKKYRDRVCSFNDDIQGTAAVTLAGLNSALRITGGELRNQKLLLMGAGEAGIGICDLVSSAMASDGLSLAEARERCWLVDSKGLVVSDRTDLNEGKRRYAHPHERATSFLEAVKSIRPTAIVGVSGQPGVFTEEIVKEVSRINQRPIIFALSNPTSKAECTATQAYTWSRGQAVYTSGSPFGPVTLEDKTYVPGQGNNAYIFPGVGLGVVLSRAKRVTEEMFHAAARALADQVAESDLELGRIYPPLEKIRDVSAEIAASVMAVAHEQGLAQNPQPDDVMGHIKEHMYRPEYPIYT